MTKFLIEIPDNVVPAGMYDAIAHVKAAVELWGGCAGKVDVLGHDPASDDEIAEARDVYGSNEVEIDDGAGTSRGEGGLWVQAWVWLERPDEEDDDEGEEA